MKKILCLLLSVLTLSAVWLLPASAATNWVYYEDFEYISNDELIQKYIFNSCAPRIISGKAGQDTFDGTKALRISSRQGFWSGLRLKLWDNNKPVIDFNKTYTLGFYMKFDNDIDKVGVQITFGQDDGYGYHEMFYAPEVGSDWLFIYGTFNLADQFKNSPEPRINALKSIPESAEMSIICESARSDVYIDKVILVEGATIPDGKPDGYGGNQGGNTNNQNNNQNNASKPDDAEEEEEIEEPDDVVSDAGNTVIGDNLTSLAAGNPVAGDAVLVGGAKTQNPGGAKGYLVWILAGSILVLAAGCGGVLFIKRKDFAKAFRKKG